MKNFGDVPENFFIYEAGWLGKRPEDFRVMEVKGAEFRAAKSGPRKGELVVMIQGTRRVTHVTRKDMERAS